MGHGAEPFSFMRMPGGCMELPQIMQHPNHLTWQGKTLRPVIFLLLVAIIQVSNMVWLTPGQEGVCFLFCNTMGQLFSQGWPPRGGGGVEKNVRKMCAAPSSTPYSWHRPNIPPYKVNYCQTLGCRHGWVLQGGGRGSCDWFWRGKR